MKEMEFSQSANIFPTKLWRLVNDSSVDAITWNHQGDGIIVNKNLIEKQFLSLNGFKASCSSSFVRQLNFYGFKKSQRFNRDEPNIHHYFHPNFKRNQPELIPLVRRRKPRSGPRINDDPESHLAKKRRVACDPCDDTRDEHLHHGESFSVMVCNPL
uniref:HSF-type DNA-binding domain-containing protein n=1 Tax=Tetraodon nigroviridis TaxID=99883 RepID=H3DPA0_TETNG